LSLRAAVRAPERVKALVLIDTAAVAWPPETLAQMSGIRDRFRDGGLDAVAPVLLAMLLGKPEIYQDWLRAWHEQPQQRLATRWPCSWVSMTSPPASARSLSRP
jgi:3-oxoadipate enol-lactonase